jgi:hypothetical protein
MGLTLFSLLVLAGVVPGLLILAGGMLLLLATEYKKTGVTLMVAGILFVLCPLLVFAVTIMQGMGIF